MIGRFKKHPLVLAFALYFLFAAALTWPLIIRLNSVLIGDFGDSRGAVSWIWWKINGFLETSINPMVAAPFGAPVNQSFSQPILEMSLSLLGRMSNEVIAYNLFVFLSFPLTALSMFIFLRSLLRDDRSSFFGGLVFGFCPAAVMQVMGGHSAFAFNVFVPLLLMSLFFNRRVRSLVSAFYVALSFSAVTLTALYFGYFSCYLLAFFFTFDYFQGITGVDSSGDREKRLQHRKVIIKNYFLIVVLIGFLILPFVYKAIVQQLTLSPEVLRNAVRIRDIFELTVYSARPWEYLIPSVDHPLIGKWILNWVRLHLHGSNIPEQTLYLGLVSLGLLVIGIILNFKKKLKPFHRYLFLFFSLGAMVMFFLSLQPVIEFGKIRIPTWSFFAHQVVPMFRVYARAGIFTMFFVACAAAVVLSHFAQSLPPRLFTRVYAVLLCVLVFEFWSLSPHPALPIDKPPEVYKWLAAQTDDSLVAIYPMTGNDDFSYYTYTFWQRLHRKKMINGAGRDNEAAWELFQSVKNLGDPGAVPALRAQKVKFIVVHEDMFEEGLIPNPIKHYYTFETVEIKHDGGVVPAVPFGLRLVRSFGADKVYAIQNPEEVPR
jgi:hypothetical protein